MHEKSCAIFALTLSSALSLPGCEPNEYYVRSENLAAARRAEDAGTARQNIAIHAQSETRKPPAYVRYDRLKLLVDQPAPAGFVLTSGPDKPARIVGGNVLLELGIACGAAGLLTLIGITAGGGNGDTSSSLSGLIYGIPLIGFGGILATIGAVIRYGGPVDVSNTVSIGVPNMLYFPPAGTPEGLRRP